MDGYEQGFEDAIHLVLLKIDEVETVEQLKKELEKLLKSAFRIRIGPTLRRLES